MALHVLLDVGTLAFIGRDDSNLRGSVCVCEGGEQRREMAGGGGTNLWRRDSSTKELSHNLLTHASFASVQERGACVVGNQSKASVCEQPMDH